MRNGLTDESEIRVTAIVCTYQRGPSLIRVVSDLLGQSAPASELIIIDQTRYHDSDTRAFLESVQDKVTLVRSAYPNLPAARNIGIALAQGEIVVFIDDDIRLPWDFLAKLRVLFHQPVDGLAPTLLEHRVRRSDPPQFQELGDLPSTRSRSAFVRRKQLVGACMAFRRSVIAESGGFDAFIGRLHPSAAGEDLEFTARLSRMGFRLGVAPSITVVHEMFWDGGCAVRQTPDPAPSRRAVTYSILKHEDSLHHMKLRAVLRLFRLYVLRRDVILSLQQLAIAPLLWAADVRFVRRTFDRFA